MKFQTILMIILAICLSFVVWQGFKENKLQIIEKTIIQTHYSPRIILYREEINEAIRDRISQGKTDMVLEISTEICPDPALAYLITISALIYDIPVSLLFGIIQVESKFNPEAVSKAGAVGLMQLLPSTFKGYSVEQLKEPNINLRLGCEHLLNLKKKYKTWGDAVIHYNGLYTKGAGYYLVRVMDMEREYERIFNERL